MTYFASLGFFYISGMQDAEITKSLMLVIKIVKTVHNMYVICRLGNIF